MWSPSWILWVRIPSRVHSNKKIIMLESKNNTEVYSDNLKFKCKKCEWTGDQYDV